jgi:teichuronic acid biosynthesis glycosyltransferase TuaG
MKLVSIIIPYFKKRQYLYKTVRSAVNQTYSNIEILIIYDDEDRTDLKTFRKKFQNFKKVKFIVNKKNIGAGLARNIGIKYAKGKFIAFLDSDDYWDKDKLKIQIKYM